MARKITFRSKVAESLEAGDAITFQSLFKKKLTESLNKKMIDIVSEIASDYDDEWSMVNRVVMAAKSFGGEEPMYELGTLSLTFESKKAAEHFTEQLENMDFVDSYELNPGQVIKAGSSEGANNIENADGVSESCDVFVYLDMDKIPMVPDIDSYISSLEDITEEKNSKKKVMDEKDKECEDNEGNGEDVEDDEDDEDAEDDEDWEDDNEDNKNLKESLNFETIFEKSTLQEFLKIKTAHYNSALKRASRTVDTICPPGRTGADCKQILTAQQKAALRKRLSLHMKRLTSGKRKRMSAHSSITRQFIKQNNLTAKSAAKASVGR